jgi:CheY-like chemotaxis protein
MIDLSILESGNLIVLEEKYNVYDMFVDIRNIIESKMRDKDVVFKFDMNDDIPEVLLGDSERVSQVILNLLTNAIKYTDKGNITLKVDSVRSNTKCRLKIMVSDTGKGIKKEDLVNIFEGKSSKEGVTLGLAVSKYLLELMGGNIEAESTYGTGSKFIVTLDQRVVSDGEKEKVSRRRALVPFKANGKRILLVDDNKLNLKVAMKMLQPYDVEVVEATSGRECLNILERDNRFDLVLMDDLMPEMSGTECLDILKKIERVDGYYIPVVVLTANAVSGMKEKYLNAGFEDYLSKPIDKYELDRILKKYLKGKK